MTTTINPDNHNALQNKDFKFEILRLPHVSYFATTIAIPSISSEPARMPNPFTEYFVPGDHLRFSPLIITFKVDEDLKNWEELFNWMVSYGHPTNFFEYADSSKKPRDLNRSKMSDASVLLSTNKYNPNVVVTFEDLFPIDLSDIMIDITQEDVPVIICTATFQYTKYTFSRNV